jgi:Tfp pilus assembly protein PilX
MNPHLRRQDGSALVTALLVSMIFLLAGMAVVSTVDTQSHESRRERERDASFQLAEGVLNSQIYRLSQSWPSKGGANYTACTNGTGGLDCPATATLTQSFSNVDYGVGTWKDVAWSTRVYDNGGTASRYYSDTAVTGQPARDLNGDNKVWLRAEAVVRGHRRVLVALVKAENLSANITPNKTLVAGYFDVSNNGAKTIIDNGGSGEVWVRCGAQPFDPPVTDCASYRVVDSKVSQVAPERVYSDANYPNAMAPEALDRVRDLAIAQENYTASGCPERLDGNVPGEVVFIENAINCKYNGNNVYNSPTVPGSLVIANGTLEILGNAEFYGVVYHANVANSSGILFRVHGNGLVKGGVIVDGLGGVGTGSSHVNLVHDPNAGGSLQTFGTAGIVQNSFREIDAS